MQVEEQTSQGGGRPPNGPSWQQDPILMLAAAVALGSGVAVVMAMLGGVPGRWWLLVAFGAAVTGVGLRRAHGYGYVLVVIGIVVVTVSGLLAAGVLRPAVGPGSGSDSGPGDTTPTDTPGPSATASPTPSGTPAGGISGAPYRVTIAEPAAGARVGRCQKFHGTSDVPAGKTIVFAVRNNNGNPTWFAEPMWDWKSPDVPPDTWYVELYFGTQPGQAYTVELFAADIATVHEAVDGLGQNQYWTFTKAPKGLAPLATTRVVRKDAKGDCG